MPGGKLSSAYLTGFDLGHPQEVPCKTTTTTSTITTTTTTTTTAGLDCLRFVCLFVCLDVLDSFDVLL